MMCGWCEGYGCDTETRVICRHCKGTGEEPENQYVFLMTEYKERHGTKTNISRTGIFVRMNVIHNLTDTEKRVIEMIYQDFCVWKCGCVTGTPETEFTEWERELFNRYGAYHRFDLD